MQSGPNAEVSFDGLVKVDNTRMDTAWVRPEIDLSGYNRIMLLSAGITYRSVREANRLYSSRASEFPLDEGQRERIEASVREVFNEELAKIDRFEIVSEAGPDTLALTGAMTDVVSFVPPEGAGRVDYYLSTLGAATLVLELSDSMSGQVLARAVDSRAIEVEFGGRSNSVSNRFELELELDDWADDIRSGLESLADTPIVRAQE
jgi:hypothetical protein